MREENDRRNYFMINLHESMGPGRDRTRDPWFCSQTRICCQTRYRLRYAARCRIILRCKQNQMMHIAEIVCIPPVYQGLAVRQSEVLQLQSRW